MKCSKNKSMRFKLSLHTYINTFSKPPIFLQSFNMSAETSVELFKLDISLFIYSKIVLVF